MIDSFTRHPHSIGETYGEHAATAATFGWTLVWAGLACLIHAALPWMFETTASRAVERLFRHMHARRALSSVAWPEAGLEPLTI
jgi:hypothetical protein